MMQKTSTFAGSLTRLICDHVQEDIGAFFDSLAILKIYFYEKANESPEFEAFLKSDTFAALDDAHEMMGHIYFTMKKCSEWQKKLEVFEAMFPTKKEATE